MHKVRAIVIVCCLLYACAASGQRFVQVDPILGKQYHKQQYFLKDGKLCPIDVFGNREWHKPCLVSLEKDKK